MIKNNEQMPSISKTFRKVMPNGDCIEENSLTVQGKDLKECVEIFDKRWINANTKTKDR